MTPGRIIHLESVGGRSGPRDRPGGCAHLSLFFQRLRWSFGDGNFELGGCGVCEGGKRRGVTHKLDWFAEIIAAKEVPKQATNNMFLCFHQIVPT